MTDLIYLRAYPEPLQQQVRQLIADARLGDYLSQRYPDRHQLQSDKALYTYVSTLKQTHMRHAPMPDRVLYDSKLDVVHNALGLNTSHARVQGGRLKVAKEIRIASLFKSVAGEFLEMIVVHELAHLKVRAHDKAFYQLCEHMLPSYKQREFDLRLYLTHRDLDSVKRSAEGQMSHL